MYCRLMAGDIRVDLYFLVVVLFVTSLKSSLASLSGRTYQAGDVVPLFLNKICPSHNPREQLEKVVCQRKLRTIVGLISSVSSSMNPHKCIAGMSQFSIFSLL